MPGGGPTTGAPGGGQPGGPATGGGAGPATAPAGGGGGPTTGGGMPLVEDFGRWVYWWEFNKDRFLRLKQTVQAARDATTASDDFFMGAGQIPVNRTVAPTAAQIHGEVLPALLAVLEESRNREITMACMMAIAKIARDYGKIDAIDTIEPFLQRGDRAVRATAALALGVSEHPDSTFKLIALLNDTPAGRKLVGRESVDDWTRTFAAYGLGVIANGARDVATQRVVFERLRDVLQDVGAPNRNVKVAVIHAMGAIQPDWRTARGELLAEKGLRALSEYYKADHGAGERLMQAHAAQAIAKLLVQRPDVASIDYYKTVFVRELDRSKSRGMHIRRSAVLALGVLGDAVEDNSSKDYAIAEALWYSHKHASDRQEAHLALLAMGQVGGNLNRTRLLSVLRRGSKAMDRPWAALALGLLARETPDDKLVAKKLRESLTATKHPDAIAASAIALGLGRCEEAVLDLRETLAKFRKRDLIAGCVCTSLAMLGDKESIPAIQRILDRSTQRPDLLRRSSVALGLLRDKTATDRLVTLLQDDASYTGIASLSVALSLIGDRTTVEPLVELLDDPERSKFARSMAAAALGGIADQSPMPWSERYTSNVNYLASVSSFVSGGYGVFEIL